MRRIEYSSNSNSRLFMDVIPDVREFSKEPKYVVGESYEITIKGEPLGVAELIFKKDFMFQNLNEQTALLICGKGIGYYEKILRGYYGTIVPEKMFSMLFFKWTSRNLDTYAKHLKNHWDKVVELTPYVQNRQLNLM